MTLNQTNSRPVVFLDRDGTLNKEVGYISNLNDLVLIEGADKAVQTLNRNEIAAVLTTNQTGAARGYYSEDHIKDLNQRLTMLLAKSGARLDAVYYCPHLADISDSPLAIDCNCRKPKPGMVEQALAEHPEWDAKRAYVIGDKSTDVELAKNIGGKGILVLTGYGEQVQAGTYQWRVEPDFVCDNIVSAVDWILKDLGLQPSSS
jgi:D-glycero-D-manno-heptose 1,7-bisphosphate phosphatase